MSADGTAAAPFRAALFLDFDGTLVDIADRPEAVRVEPGLPDDLSRLRDALGGAVAIVTGRAVADIEHFLPASGLDVCGLHGLELRLGGRVERPQPPPEMNREVARIREALASFEGVVIEDKGIGAAIHWRLAPEAEAEARRAVAEAVARLGAAYKVQDGKSVAEIVLARSGKGHGIRRLMEEAPYAGRVPVFAGDDRTDEHGFSAVNELGGLSIKVGEGDTAASRRVASPSAFRDWMAGWSGRSAPDLPRA